MPQERNDEHITLKPDPDVFSTKTSLAYAGRVGERKLANDVIADLEEEGEVSLTKLQKMILGET